MEINGTHLCSGRLLGGEAYTAMRCDALSWDDAMMNEDDDEHFVGHDL